MTAQEFIMLHLIEDFSVLVISSRLFRDSFGQSDCGDQRTSKELVRLGWVRFPD